MDIENGIIKELDEIKEAVRTNRLMDYDVTCELIFDGADKQGFSVWRKGKTVQVRVKYALRSDEA